MPESPGSPLGILLGPVSTFVEKFGLSTFLAIVFVGLMLWERQDGTNAEALQMKDMNGRLQHLSDKVVEHHDQATESSEEQTRVMRTICVQLANGDRSVINQCLGARP